MCRAALPTSRRVGKTTRKRGNPALARAFHSRAADRERPMYLGIGGLILLIIILVILFR
jgi:type II secretory pathway component PulM